MKITTVTYKRAWSIWSVDLASHVDRWMSLT